jgi:lipopolysaccharide export system permease protein
MSRISWLLLRAVVPAVAGVWAVLAAIDSLSVLVNEIDEIGIGNYDASAVLGYTLLTLPRRAYGLFLYAAVIGTLLGLGQLAAKSELIALQAAGYSRARIAGGSILAVALLLLPLAAGIELLGSSADRRANAMVAQAKAADVGLMAFSGFWIRDGERIWNAGQVVSRPGQPLELWQIRVLDFEARRLVRLIEAATARQQPGGWLLKDVRVREIAPERVQQSQQPSLRLDSPIDADLINATALRPRYLGIGELLDSIAFARANRLDALPFESALWYRLTLPLATLALVFAAIPFAFGALRSGGAGKQIFLGIVLALVFFFAQRTLANMFETYRWEMAVAYLLPPLLLVLGGWLGLRRRP